MAGVYVSFVETSGGDKMRFPVVIGCVLVSSFGFFASLAAECPQFIQVDQLNSLIKWVGIPSIYDGKVVVRDGEESLLYSQRQECKLEAHAICPTRL